MDDQRQQVIRALKMGGTSSESATVILGRIDADIRSGMLPLDSAAHQLNDQLKELRSFRSDASKLEDLEIREAVEAYYERRIEFVYQLAEEHGIRLGGRIGKASGDNAEHVR